MSAQILDGKKLADSIRQRLKSELEACAQKSLPQPVIVSFSVGDDRGILAYSNAQKKIAEDIGITYKAETCTHDISHEDFVKLVKAANDDSGVTGILIHKPLPEQIDYQAVIKQLSIPKDIEGVHPENVGNTMFSRTGIVPATAAAVMTIVQSAGIALCGKEVVIVGHSEIVGKPLSLLFLEQFATVTVCHIATSEAGLLADHVARADIVVSAVGKPGVVQGQWIKKGATVIDVGINHVDGAIVGDVDFDGAKENAGYITPVPGGVGPVTTVMLMSNCIELLKKQQQ